MKKVLFMMLCCAVFFIGCNKATQEEQVVGTQEIDVTADVPIDTVVTSTETSNTEQAQTLSTKGEAK